MRLGILFIAGILVGCAQKEPAPLPKNLVTSAATAPTPVPPPPAAPIKPYVMHLPGVSGTSIVDWSLRDGLRKGGFDGPFEIYDWTCHDPGIPALHARMRNEEQAAIVAEILTKQFRAHPDQPIYLTCHSGGSGPATWALERLPADVQVACFVMLAPALSPGYDLSKALSHVSHNAYCFHSPDDDLVLGTGTKMFGTIDGVRSDAAGRIGFQQPPDADAAQYAKLIQQPYQSAWSRFGHIGGHIGCMGSPFVQAIVAPIMLGHAATAEVLNNSYAQPLPDILWPK
jgi:hypothetical protein